MPSEFFRDRMTVASNHSWYVRRGKVTKGPFPAAQITRNISQGRIRADDLISRDGEDWLQVAVVTALHPEGYRGRQTRKFPVRQQDEERLTASRRKQAAAAALANERRRQQDRRAREPEEVLERRQRRERVVASLHPRRIRSSRYIGLVLLLIGAITWVGVMLKPGSGALKPDCQAPAAPGVNWSNCRLEGLSLSDLDLKDARLRNSRAHSAVFVGTRLEGADLAYADLALAKFGYANLQHAVLKGANLKGADLSNADLRDADLSYADLTGALLGKSVLDGARLGNSIWIDGRLCAPDSVGTCKPVTQK